MTTAARAARSGPRHTRGPTTSEKTVATRASHEQRRLQWARGLLWAAVVVAFIYSTPKTSTMVESGALSIFDIVRGGGPVVLLSLGWFLAKPRRRAHVGMQCAVGLFLVVTISSTLWSIAPLVTGLKAVPLAASFIALERLARLYASTEEALRALATMVHALLLLTAVEYLLLPERTFVSEASLAGADGLGLYDPTPRLRSWVPLVSPNPLAFAASAGILAVLLRIGPRWATRSPLVSAILVCVYLVELLATRTRTALAVSAVLIAVALIAQFRRRPGPAIGIGLAALAAILWAWSPERVEAFQAFLARGQDLQGIQSLTGRTNIWSLALAKWEDERLLGFGYFAGHRLGLVGVSETQSNIDSTWLELLLDVGLLGTIPLGIAVVIGVTCAFRISHWTFRVWALTLLAYGLAISFFNPTLQVPGVGLVLFGFPLLAASVADEKKSEHRSGLNQG